MNNLAQTVQQDPIDRVVARALSSFIAVGEKMNYSHMEGYADNMVKMLVAKLTTSQSKEVIQECITNLAVLAAACGADFAKNYNGLMPLLKNYIMKATTAGEVRLRGKAFECMSLLGYTVSKDRFRADAVE